MRTGCTNFNKVEFLHAIKSIREKTFKGKSIRAGFRETGLIPYNPEIVIKKMRQQTSAANPEPKLELPGLISPKTPRRYKRLMRVATDALLREDSLSWEERTEISYLLGRGLQHTMELLFSPDITSRDLVVVDLLSQPPTQIVQSITL